MRHTALPVYRKRRVLAAALGCFFLAACAQQPAPPLPAREAAVMEANRHAEAQVRSGNLVSAARYYGEALRLAQSIEDTEGIASNAINLSIVYQRIGKIAEARASLAPVLDQGKLMFPPGRLAQAALRRAILDLEEGRYASATDWIERAASYCGARDCALSGAIQNVKAQLALEAGNADAAAASARAALAASRGSGDRAESANALRLLGITAVRAGDAVGALAFFDQALAIDRELALARKIYLDLIGLGRARALRGEHGAARTFYERALTVSEADHDTQGAAEARALIDALGERPASR
jgi:tetratricopeptide (TPR) repeat protein